MAPRLAAILLVWGLALAPAATWAQQKPERDPLPVRLWNKALQNERGGRPVYTLLQHYSYCHDATGKVVTAPANFVTDFASIPKEAQFLFPPDGPYARAAIIHDWMYAIGTRGDEAGRRFADDVFKAAMAEYGVLPIWRDWIYQTVRWRGARGYGLKSDWKFWSAQDRAPVPAPIPREQARQFPVFPGCVGFQQYDRTGYLLGQIPRPAT